jgi:hypothetical protein
VALMLPAISRIGLSFGVGSGAATALTIINKVAAKLVSSFIAHSHS